MVPPFPPLLRDVNTTPYSVNISWVVPSIVFNQENYTVQYGTDMTILLNTSEFVQGSSNRNVTNGNFSINITGLTPFTAYYYTIVATNTVGSTRTRIMNFITDETGGYFSYSWVFLNKIVMYTEPSIAPMGFMMANLASNSITFQWTLLTDSEANGIVRQYVITCNNTFMVSTIQYSWSILHGTDCLVTENRCISMNTMAETTKAFQTS